MTALPSSRMNLNFLLHPEPSRPNPPSPTTTTVTTTTTTTTTTATTNTTSSWSDRSDLTAPVLKQNPNPLPITPHQQSSPMAMMQLANAAALASRACAPIPVSPVSSAHSTSYSVDQQIITPPPSPPPPTQPTTSSRSHQCTICSQSFSQKVRFLHHLFAVHNIRTYETRTILPCSKCDAAFLRNTDRSKHDLCVHQRLRPFRCDVVNCTSSFFFAKDLSKHRTTVHLRHKPFTCSICPKAFGKREHMTSHIKRVHQKLRPFKCDVCDIRLASKYNLQGHLKTAAHAAAEALANRDAVRSQYLRRTD